MRIVRDTGNVSLLMPEGIDNFVDAPFPVHNAIIAGLRWLRFEEFPNEERPPKRIWLDGEEMDRWWEKVEKDREAKYKSPGKAEDTTDFESDEYDHNPVDLIARG